VVKANDYSFPSDHSVVGGGLTISILLILASGAWRRRRHARRGLPQVEATGASVPGVVGILAAASVLLGLFLCFARVYVGAHYPGDVVAGYLLAAVAVLVASLLRPPGGRRCRADGLGEPTAAPGSRTDP
jgi:undecaprenyl-diphosphatase